ncbi:MAG: MmcQ/YjbR family DNA-binding protein [Caldilineaceae bacterium]
MDEKFSLMDAQYLAQVRTICLAQPGTEERLSHGEPTFFIGKKVFTMFANNHHNDGRIAVWIPAPTGAQEGLIEAAPHKFFKPPYVGHRGWVGIELAKIDADELAHHIETAWRLIAPKRLQKARAESGL